MLVPSNTYCSSGDKHLATHSMDVMMCSTYGFHLFVVVVVVVVVVVAATFSHCFFWSLSSDLL